MMVMEQMELEVTQSEAAQVAQSATRAHEKSQQYAFQASHVDHIQVERYESQGANMTKIAKQEQEEANSIWDEVEKTDEARLELLDELEREKDNEKELMKKLRNDKFHSCLCGWKGIRAICAVLGGTTQLQTQAYTVDSQIHRDMQQLEAVERREFLEAAAAEILQGTANKYEHFRDELVKLSQLWSQREQLDRAEAIEWNQTAQSLDYDSELMKARVESYIKNKNHMSTTKRQLLDSASIEARVSRRYSVVSVILAMLALPFFVHSAAPKIVVLTQDLVAWSRDSTDDRETEVWRAAIYNGLHVLFFLASAVWCSDYVFHLDQYIIEKRAVVVLYFAFLASVGQSLFLHALPHDTAERPWAHPIDLRTIGLICKYFAFRSICLVPLFSMELLFVWLSPLRTLFLNPSWKQAFLTHILMTVLLTVYLCYFEHGREEYSPSDDSTALMMEHAKEEFHSSPATEQTPLNEASSATATEILPHMYLAGMDIHVETSSHYSLQSSSPFFISIQEELTKLILPFELFVVFCMLLVLCIGLDNLVGNCTVHIPLLLLSTSSLAFGVIQYVCCMKWAQTEQDDAPPPKILYI